MGYFYAAIDIFVMASKNETYGMVTIESMLAGKQIVGTNSAGTKELLNEEKHGYYFEWMDADTLERALHEVLANPDTGDARARLAKEFALQSFSHTLELDQIEELINSNS